MSHVVSPAARRASLGRSSLLAHRGFGHPRPLGADREARTSRPECSKRGVFRLRSSRVTLLAYVLFWLLVFTTNIAAPPPACAADTPEQVVTRYIAATRALKWDEIADMMHPVALTEFKTMMRPIVEIDSTGEATQLLFQVDGLAAYDALAPRDAFARLMRTMTQQNPMIAEALTDASGTVIGHVAEAPDLMHVLYRVGRTSGALKGTKIEVVTLKRDGSNWRPLLAGNIEGLAEALRQQVGGP